MIDTRPTEIGIIQPISPLTNAPLEMELYTGPVRELESDQTGGLELFIDMLNLDSKQDASATQVLPVLRPAAAPETPVQPAERPTGGFLRRALGRAKAAISKAVATVRDATKWLFSDIPNPRLIERSKNKLFGYKGRHHTQRTWFGVQRSTASAVSITRQRHMRAQQTSTTKEGALSSYYQLPEYWVSHLAQFVQVIRDHEDTLREAPGRHFVCR